MTDAERWVTLICTGHGRGGHPKKRVDRIVLVNGEAKSVDRSGGANGLRRGFAESYAGQSIADFDLMCTRCQRSPQVTRARMTALVSVWLDSEPQRRSVVRDISDPATARMF